MWLLPTIRERVQLPLIEDEIEELLHKVCSSAETQKYLDKDKRLPFKGYCDIHRLEIQRDGTISEMFNYAAPKISGTFIPNETGTNIHFLYEPNDFLFGAHALIWLFGGLFTLMSFLNISLFAATVCSFITIVIVMFNRYLHLLAIDRDRDFLINLLRYC